MSDKREGGGKFHVAIQTQVRAVYDSLSPGLKSAVRSRLIACAIDPEATRVVFVESQQLHNGTIKDGDQFYFVRMRFVYDPAKQLIVLADLSKPKLMTPLN